MSVGDWLLNSARSDWTDITFTALSEQQVAEPKYQHLWQGWRTRLRGLIRTEVELDYTSGTDEDGWGYDDVPFVVAKHHRFCGWRELFRPTTSSTRLVPVGQPIHGSMALKGSTLALREPLGFTWGQDEPPTTISHMRAANASGTALFDVALSKPVLVSPKDMVSIGNISLSIT